MYSLRKYFVLFFLTAFVLGSMAATAMAYCGSGHEASITASTLDNVMHHQPVTVNRDSDGTGAAATLDDSADVNGSTTGCLDCYGNFCHSQSIVSHNLGLGHYAATVALHVEQSINPSLIILTTIPQPPKQLS